MILLKYKPPPQKIKAAKLPAAGWLLLLNRFKTCLKSIKMAGMAKKENVMQEQVFIAAAIKPWNRAVFAEALTGFAGRWHFVSDPVQLTVDPVRKFKSAMIFPEQE